MWQMAKRGMNTVPYCSKMINHNLGNLWFSPYIPSHLLQVATVCATYDNIMKVMMKKGYTIWRFAIVYIYEITFQLLLNTSESILFKTCLPAGIVNNPAGFCQTVIS